MNAPKTTKGTRGGAGRGQGRKPIAEGVESVVVQVRCTPEQKAKFLALGGAVWFRFAIDGADADGTVSAANLARHPAIVMETARMLFDSLEQRHAAERAAESERLRIKYGFHQSELPREV